MRLPTRRPAGPRMVRLRAVNPPPVRRPRASRSLRITPDSHHPRIPKVRVRRSTWTLHPALHGQSHREPCFQPDLHARHPPKPTPTLLATIRLQLLWDHRPLLQVRPQLRGVRPRAVDPSNPAVLPCRILRPRLVPEGSRPKRRSGTCSRPSPSAPPAMPFDAPECLSRPPDPWARCNGEDYRPS
jgi:hypothetical protein